jgi:hypothetical protein
MELFSDPVMLGVLKVVGIAIAFIMAIPFIFGIVIGWFIGRISK